MLTDQETLILLQQQVQDLQACIYEMAKNQKAIVQAGILTNNAIKMLATKVDEITGGDVEGEPTLRTIQ